MAAAGGGEIRGGGGGLRQVDIQGVIADAEAKLAGNRNKKRREAMGSNPRVRRLDDLQALVERVGGIGKFIDVDSTGQKVTDNPGVTDVLHGLGIRGVEQENLQTLFIS